MPNIVISCNKSISVVKKSKFICFLYYVENIEEIKSIINDIQHEYHDARHVIYAYRLNELIMKADEDQEPSGTCAKPILMYLQQHDVINVLVIIVRYFGGILLGVNNLKKAYLDTFYQTIENNLQPFIKSYYYTIICSYNDIGKVNNWIHKTNSQLLNQQYNENNVEISIKSTIEPNEAQKTLNLCVKNK